jgi:TPR repeat protein
MPSPSIPPLGDTAAEQQAAKLIALAEKDPRAAYDLGLRYFRGDGVRQDSYQALKWMRDAAERGFLKAQTAVGRFLPDGA